MKTLVILPTYNENDNLRGLIGEILECVPSAYVLVVDDASPDGTGRTADELRSTDQRIFVLHRTGKRGRGLAGREGFVWALSRGYEAIVEMDADFSHPPRFIPRLLGALDGSDVVIGSRCVTGAEVARKSFFRNSLSAAARVVIRVLLRTQVRDCTSGFRAFRREALAKIGVERMRSTGPSVVEEVLYACQRKQLRIFEIPIRFDERRAGRSKLGAGRLFETLWMLIQLRWVHPR